MYEGMYSFEYKGVDGAGVGLIVVTAGRVFGSDGGVQYDGTSRPAAGRQGWIDLHLTLTVPPGVPLVTGMAPQPAEYRFDLDLAIQARGETRGIVDTPYGPVGVAVRFLREIPRGIAA